MDNVEVIDDVFSRKDKVQKEALNAWRDNNYIGTIEAATGVGKTRIGVIAASKFAKEVFYDYKVLIISPTEIIRDDKLAGVPEGDLVINVGPQHPATHGVLHLVITLS